MLSKKKKDQILNGRAIKTSIFKDFQSQASSHETPFISSVGRPAGLPTVGLYFLLLIHSLRASLAGYLLPQLLVKTQNLTVNRRQFGFWPNASSASVLTSWTSDDFSNCPYFTADFPSGFSAHLHLSLRFTFEIFKSTNKAAVALDTNTCT